MSPVMCLATVKLGVEVHIRCAALGDRYVIDLCEPGKSRAIVVRPGGWTVTEHHGMMFTRRNSMKPPQTGGRAMTARLNVDAIRRKMGRVSRDARRGTGRKRIGVVRQNLDGSWPEVPNPEAELLIWVRRLGILTEGRARYSAAA